MEKRYQVFISSTFQDLEVARQEVSQALLRADCFPAGMELFPAADEEQFEFIKQVIQQSDYYIIISAGRYGSIHPKTLSYTEMEYDYAVEIGKPVIRLLHKDPFNKLTGDKIERTDEGRAKLNAFRKKLTECGLVRFWEETTQLGSEAVFSLMDLRVRTPAKGWLPGTEWAKSILVPGDRGVNIGGDVSGSVVVTGDENTVSISEDKGARGNFTKAFLVHGHDHDTMHKVAYHLYRSGIEPIVLQDQPDKGRTIVEKFEDYADVGFAVILATPDDIGRPKSGEDRPRPRQNVIWEFGYFVGKLGRSRVCFMLTGDVEVPSDLGGVVYVGIDEAGAWKMRLYKELKAAGFDPRIV